MSFALFWCVIARGKVSQGWTGCEERKQVRRKLVSHSWSFLTWIRTLWTLESKDKTLAKELSNRDHVENVVLCYTARDVRYRASGRVTVLYTHVDLDARVLSLH